MVKRSAASPVSLGFTEHRADKATKQIKSLVGQAGGDIERDGDQCGMAALTFECSDMLRRSAAGLAGKLGEAGLMHTMSARRIETDRANMIQALNQPQHRDRLRRFRHLAQPGEPGLVGFLSADRQCIKLLPLVSRKSIRQPALGFPPRPMAGFNTKPFQPLRPRNDDPALPALPQNSLRQMGELVVLNRARQ